MFGKTKNNFAMNQFVIIGQTSSPDLDGVEAQVIGKAVEDVSDVYILLLPHSINNQTGIILTEVCLKASTRINGQCVYGQPITC